MPAAAPSDRRKSGRFKPSTPVTSTSAGVTEASKPADAPVIAKDDAGIILVDPKGDLILDIHHDQPQQDFSFRVKSSALSDASGYFRLLLDPARFAEGRRLAASKVDHGQPINGQPGPIDLPRMTIDDIGHISAVKSIEPLLTDLLLLLHRQKLPSWPPPISNLANLVVVADRFDALATLKSYAHSQRVFQSIDTKHGNPRSKPTSLQAETRLRQRAFIAAHLDHSPWLLSSTQALIRAGPTPPSDHPGAAWTDLPSHLELELHHRRLAALDTLHSIQLFFLGQYTSRTRQCRLGYDSSAACDSFQLGEMVRFFTRIGTLGLSGTDLLPVEHEVMLDPMAPQLHGQSGTGYRGDLLDLLDRFRQCPAYQVDANHHHCGLRTRLIPVLEVVERALDELGVCADCWRERRAEYAWAEARRPLSWTRGGDGAGAAPKTARKSPSRAGGGSACLEAHLAVRDMFLAKERIWERPRDQSETGIMFGKGLTLGWRA